MRMREGPLVDIQFGYSVISSESRSGGERNGPERGDSMKTSVEPFSVKGNERPNPEVPAPSRFREGDYQHITKRRFLTKRMLVKEVLVLLAVC